MPLLQEIRRYVPRDQPDARTQSRFIEFVGRHQDCCERSLEVGHITASAWVVNPAGSKVVLVHHRKLDRWLQPGGHADGNADTAAVALREVLEETGLGNLLRIGPEPFDLDIHSIPAFGNVPAHLHYDVRHAFRLTEDTPLVLSDESHDLVWAPITELERFHPDASLLRMRDKWLSMAGSDRP